MRVSDRWMFQRGGDAVGSARIKHEKAIGELSSGTRVAHPWEDPASAGLAVGHDTQARAHEAVGTVMQRAQDELQSMDDGLNDVIEALSRGRELALQLANDTYGAQERAGAAAEVTGLFNAALATLNRRVGDRFLFGGFKDNAPPFDPTGNFVGDSNIRRVEVAKGVWQDVSIASDVAIKGAGGGVDVLGALQTLATALSSNDTATLRSSLDTLSDGITQISKARTQVSSHAAVLDVAYVATRGAKDAELSLLSKAIDADPFDAAMRLQLAERGLEASIEALSRSGKLTLLGKL